MLHRIVGPALAACLLLTPSISFADVSGSRLTLKAYAKAEAGNPNPTIVPPVEIPYGKTYSEWSVLWWQWFLPLTGAQFNVCTIGQPDPNVAFLLAGPAQCKGSVAPETALFFPVANVECSDLEPDPFYGADAKAREACAKRFFHALTNLSATIDGQPVQNITSYDTFSPDFPFTVGPNNVFGIPCAGLCTGQSTGYGYYLMVKPLPEGDHAIHISADIQFGKDVFPVVNTMWTLTVRH